MTSFANAMEVFKLLDKSNCGKCNEATCLAFASKVFLGEKDLELCPSLSAEILDAHREKRKRNFPVKLSGICLWQT